MIIPTNMEEIYQVLIRLSFDKENRNSQKRNQILKEILLWLFFE